MVVRAGGLHDQIPDKASTAAVARVEAALSRRQLLERGARSGLALALGGGIATAYGGFAAPNGGAALAAHAANGTLGKLERTHYARVASYQQPPHGWFDPSDGKEKGIDFEILQYILGKLGVKTIDYVVADWNALIPGLEAGRWDLMSVGAGITKPRLEQIRFSEPLYQYGEALIVRKGNPKKIHGMSDWAGKKIGGILGSVDDQVVRSVKGAHYVPYQKYSDMYIDVKDGRIDAGLADETEAAWDFKTLPQPELQILHEWKGKTVYLIGMEFKKSDGPLQHVFNSWISKMKKDGMLLRILEKYGLGRANMAPCTVWTHYNSTGAAQC